MNKDTTPVPGNAADKAGKSIRSLVDSGNLIQSIQDEVAELTSETANLYDKALTKETAELFKTVLLVDPSKHYTRPEIFISIGDGRAATLGNISLGIGKMKSGKTQMISLTVAAVLCSIYGVDFIYGDLFTVNRPKDKDVVLWFDTEQDEYDVQLIFRRLRKLTGSDSLPNIQVYALRDRSPEERRVFISSVISSTPNCCIAIIDGVKDLGFDPLLDPREACEIVTELMRLSKRMKVHIMSVLHQNKADNNARGHIGSEYMNKCEFAFSVEKDKQGNRIVKPEAARGKEFEPFAFSIVEDEDGDAMPKLINEFSNQEQNDNTSKKISPFNYQPDFHHRILSNIYSQKEQYKYEELITSIRVGFEAFSIRFGRNKRVDFLAYYQNQGWIKRTGETGKSLYIYSPV